MKRHWLALAADMLQEASEEYSNHGCNDWDWPVTWTAEQIAEFLAAYKAWAGDPTDDREHLGDHEVMSFLASSLIKMTEEGG